MNTIQRALFAASFAVLGAALSGCPDKDAAAAPATAERKAEPRAEACRDCGTVTSIREVRQKGEGTGAGAFMGAVVGGVAGHQVGGGRGKDVATVAGAVGGAMAGHEIEKRARSTTSYDVTVRMESGGTRTINTVDGLRFAVGDKVRVNGDTLTRG